MASPPLQSAKEVSTEAAESLWATFHQILRHKLVFRTVGSFLQHDGMTSSAALAFYFLMSLLPFLIFLASALALLPIPDLSIRMVSLVRHFVPAETMPLAESMLISTMDSSGKLLSIGFVLTIISASNAFAAANDSLHTIFDKENTLSFWGSRIRAIGTTFVIGGLTVVALGAMLLGPNFAKLFEHVLRINHTVVWLWPVARYIIAIGGALAALEMLYYMGSGRSHSFGKQMPGSVFAVMVWLLSSALLGIYLREFASFNAMYGTLASFIVLMMWLQITAIAILLGAELNVALVKFRSSQEGRGSNGARQE